MASAGASSDPHHGHHHHHHRHRHPVPAGVVRPAKPHASLLSLSLAHRLGLASGLLLFVWALLLGVMR